MNHMFDFCMKTISANHMKLFAVTVFKFHLDSVNCRIREWGVVVSSSWYTVENDEVSRLIPFIKVMVF